MKTIIPEIIFRYSEEASSAWTRRQKALYSAVYTLDDLAALDDHIEANLDGLRISGQTGLETCQEALATGWPGDFFAAFFLAAENADQSTITSILEMLLKKRKPKLYKGIISALGWLPYEKAEPIIRQLVSSDIPEHKFIGIAASALHRKKPGNAIKDVLAGNLANPLLYVRSLKAAGELGLVDLLPQVETGLTQTDEKCYFYAARSALLLGSANAVAALKKIVFISKTYGEEAVGLAMRKMKIPDSVKWQNDLAANPAFTRLAITGTGALGDVSLIPWLIDRMNTPNLARIAGESFTMITGAEVTGSDLEGKKPEGFEAGPNDDPKDNNVEMDIDQDLPWLNAEKIKLWWNANENRYAKGTRYLTGLPINQDNLYLILKTGTQRQRQAATLELALLNPGKPLFNTFAPGFRQKKLLGML